MPAPVPAPAGAGAPVEPRTADAPVAKTAEVIDPATMNKDLAEVFKSATEALGTIKDGPTAQAVIPQVEGINGTLDRLKGLYDKIPAPARAAIIATVTESLPKIKDLVTKVLATPGIGDKLKPILEAMVAKLLQFST